MIEFSSVSDMPDATYTMGPPIHPPVLWDDGFGIKTHTPTAKDYALLAEWVAILNAGEAGQKVPLLPHNDLSDALAAYRHYLYGEGKDRTFSYERYVTNDLSGKTTLENALNDIEEGAEQLYKGYHIIWLSGDVSVTQVAGQTSYSMVVTVHAEDKYNFNAGAADIATGIPDSANGELEAAGLAHGYMDYSTLQRTVRWTSTTPAVLTPTSGGRERQPQDNRRLRNRV